MTSTLKRRAIRPALAALALALALAVTGSASARHQRAGEPLVVRADATVLDAPCPNGICTMPLSDGRFSGTLGSGDLAGTVKLGVAEAHPNGQGGLCAPVGGDLVLGAGTPDRLVLAVAGDSCQDGAGPVTSASFTTLARFAVARGTGDYATAHGRGLMAIREDAADHAGLTLLGRLSR